MATAVGFRRGTALENDTFVGVEGEIVVNLTNGSVHVHTGDTYPGGYELARKDFSNCDIDVLTTKNGAKNLLYTNLSNLSNVFSESAYNIFTETYNLAKSDGTNISTLDFTTKTNTENGPQLARADTANINTNQLAEINPTDPTKRVIGLGKPLAFADLANVEDTTLSTKLSTTLKNYLKADYSNLDTTVLAGTSTTGSLASGMPALALASLENVNKSFLDIYQLKSNIVSKLELNVDDDNKYPSTAWVNAKLSDLSTTILPEYPDTSNIPTEQPDDPTYVDPRPYLLAYTQDLNASEYNETSLQWINTITANNILVDKNKPIGDMYDPAEAGGNPPSVQNVIEYISEEVQEVVETTDDITAKIPSTASFSNQLADKAFVNSSINNMAAFYITSTAEGDAFDTKADLVAGPWYYRGATRTPTANDYALVKDDETKDHAVTRYTYDGTQWAFQYIVNNSPFTQAQVDAINSGITDTDVTQITTNKNNINALNTSKQNTLSETQLAAVNSGITNTIVSQINTNTTNITALQTEKQDTLTAGTGINISGTTISSTFPTLPTEDGNYMLVVKNGIATFVNIGNSYVANTNDSVSNIITKDTDEEAQAYSAANPKALVISTQE